MDKSKLMVTTKQTTKISECGARAYLLLRAVWGRGLSLGPSCGLGVAHQRDGRWIACVCVCE